MFCFLVFNCPGGGNLGCSSAEKVTCGFSSSGPFLSPALLELGNFLGSDPAAYLDGVGSKVWPTLNTEGLSVRGLSFLQKGLWLLHTSP